MIYECLMTNSLYFTRGFLTAIIKLKVSIQGFHKFTHPIDTEHLYYYNCIGDGSEFHCPVLSMIYKADLIGFAMFKLWPKRANGIRQQYSSDSNHHPSHVVIFVSLILNFNLLYSETWFKAWNQLKGVFVTKSQNA